MANKKSLYQELQVAISKGEKLLAVLIDPDKTEIQSLSAFIQKVNASMATHIFVGGSKVGLGVTESLVTKLKKETHLPIFLFPGDVNQITEKGDALLFLSLISGRNPEYLIGKHVESVSKLRSSKLEIVPTAYLLIENGKETSVQKVTGTKPMSRANIQYIVDTAKAGELLGMKLIYLEAGSGAMHPISGDIIAAVKNDIAIPLIVGGGIRKKEQIENAYCSGADMVVIGTAFEENEEFFEELKTPLTSGQFHKRGK